MANVDNIGMREEMQFNTLQDDILYVQLANSELAKEITGVVRKRTKMTDTAPATREDCYITSLSLPAGSVQLGTSHVNIIVPDKTDCTLAGVAQTFSANTERIKQLAELAYKVLRKHYCGNGWCYTCEEQDVIAETDMQAHRLWFKIRFTFHNVD
jgi:hypothetical protein